MKLYLRVNCKTVSTADSKESGESGDKLACHNRPLILLHVYIHTRAFLYNKKVRENCYQLLTADCLLFTN